MNRYKRFNSLLRLVPNTFRGRILLTLLVLSLGPLLAMGFYAYNAVESTTKKATADMGEEIVGYVVRLQQQHLDKQAALIDRRLEEVKKQVLAARYYAEQLFNRPGPYPARQQIQLIREDKGYLWENPPGDASSVGISAKTALNPELLDRLSLSKYLEPLFQQSLKQTPDIAAIYYILPESAWRIYPKMNVKEEVERGYLEPDVDLTTFPFFSLAAGSNRQFQNAVWTEPYMDITHRNLLFTVSTPVFSEKGQLLGVIGADVTIKRVVDHILDFRFREDNAYALLYDKNGELIAYQKKAEEDLPFFYESKPVLPNLKPGTIELNGKQKIFLQSSIENTGWTLAFVIPKNEITAPIVKASEHQIQSSKQEFFISLFNTVVALVFLLLAVSLLFWRYFTRPVRELLAGLSSIRSGDLNIQLKAGYLEEFNQLTGEFNTMTHQINSLVRDLKNFNSELERKVAERTAQLAEANASLRKTNQELQKMEHSRRELFANISHDLKTPITLIMGYIEAFRDGMIQRQDIERNLDRMYRHITSLNRLAQDLYELGTVEMKEHTFTFTETDPATFFQRILASYGEQERIRYQIDSPLPRVKIDPEYMKRAVFNLIDNALKYSNPPSPVVVNVRMNENCLEFSVTDQGYGIPAKDLPHIFDRFYRVDKARNSRIPGNGLGLAIVKEIIDAHGGQITAESEEGSGSTFTCRIPVASPEAKNSLKRPETR